MGRSGTRAKEKEANRVMAEQARLQAEADAKARLKCETDRRGRGRSQG